MNLVEVDVIGFEALQALVELEQDRLSREPAPVRLLAHHAMHLGCDHHRFAADVGLEKSPHDGLAFAARVHVGGIKKVNAQIKCLPEKWLALCFVERPGLAAGQDFARDGASVGHAAETNARDFQTGVAKIEVFHRCSCFEFRLRLCCGHAQIRATPGHAGKRRKRRQRIHV